MLTFDEAKHEYRLDGVAIPSVTFLLSRLHSFAGVPEDVLAAAKTRGSNAHAAAHYFDEGDLDEAMLDAQTAGYLAGWKRFITERKPTWTAIEKPVFHPIHRYAGTPDRFGVMDGAEVQVDIKTSLQSHPVWDLQTSAYNHAAGKPHARRYTCQLRPDGTYKVTEWKNPAAWPTFVALVALHNWGVRHP